MKKAIFLGLLFVLIVPFTSHAALDANLKYGSSGSAVTELQEFLTAQSVYSGPISGNFYALTLAGVKAFQTVQGVTPISGYWGPLSRTKAQSLLDLSASNADEQTETGTVTPEIPAQTTTPVSLPPVQNSNSIQSTITTIVPADDLNIDTSLQPASITQEDPYYDFSYEIKDSINPVIGLHVTITLDGIIQTSFPINQQVLMNGSGQWTNNQNYALFYWNIPAPKTIGNHIVTITASDATRNATASFPFTITANS